jgi:hypothetical protein
MTRVAAIVPVFIVLLAADTAAAQERCELVRSRGTTQSFNVSTPYQVDHIPYPVFECDGGLTIQADSATFMHSTRQVSLYRNVVYADTATSLQADRAQYDSPTRHLAAQGNVVLEDLRRGSRIEGPTLDYYEAMEGRPEAIVEIPAGRPRTTVLRDVVEDGIARTDTTRIDSDALQIVGDDAFHFRGDVVIRGTDLFATSGFADFLEGGGRMVLRSLAHVEAQDVVLNGDTVIAVQDTAAGVMRSVDAMGRARLDAEDVDIDAPTVRTYFDAGELQRLVAVGRGGAPGAAIEQAHAYSEQFNLTADSIDALMPAQLLEEVAAVGNAYGERLAEDDSTRILIAPVTAADSALARMLAHDWVRGDTVRAFFADAPDTATVAPGDTARERVLERILALGAPARSANRMVNEDRPDDPAGISYLTASSIVVWLEGGQVDTVEAEGNVKGVYLQPPQAAPAVAEGRGP